MADDDVEQGQQEPDEKAEELTKKRRLVKRLIAGIICSMLLNAVLFYDDYKLRKELVMTGAAMTYLGTQFQKMYVDMQVLMEAMRQDPQLQDIYKFAMEHKSEIEAAIAARQRAAAAQQQQQAGQ